MHNIPLTDIERTALTNHGLAIEKPSQLSDAFRHGLSYGLAHCAERIKELEKNDARYRWLRDSSNWSEDGITPIIANG